jgi:predicted RNase H-like HicB family nuclease
MNCLPIRFNIHYRDEALDGRRKRMKQVFTASVWREGEWYVAQCLQVDVASQGETEEDAIMNLREALELHFESPVASTAPHIRPIEIDIRAA